MGVEGNFYISVVARQEHSTMAGSRYCSDNPSEFRSKNSIQSVVITSPTIAIGTAGIVSVVFRKKTLGRTHMPLLFLLFTKKAVTLKHLAL